MFSYRMTSGWTDGHGIV